jgi:hypothetical protein
MLSADGRPELLLENIWCYGVLLGSHLLEAGFRPTSGWPTFQPQQSDGTRTRPLSLLYLVFERTYGFFAAREACDITRR